MLEKQTTGLINTIDYKNETLNKIKSAKDYFGKDEETFDKFSGMQNEVEYFFQSVDRRIIVVLLWLHIRAPMECPLCQLICLSRTCRMTWR